MSDEFYDGELQGIVGAWGKGTSSRHRRLRRWHVSSPQRRLGRAFWTGKSVYGGRTSLRENAECVRKLKTFRQLGWGGFVHREEGGLERAESAWSNLSLLCPVRIPDPKNPQAS